MVGIMSLELLDEEQTHTKWMEWPAASSELSLHTDEYIAVL